MSESESVHVCTVYASIFVSYIFILLLLHHNSQANDCYERCKAHSTGHFAVSSLFLALTVIVLITFYALFIPLLL